MVIGRDSGSAHGFGILLYDSLYEINIGVDTEDVVERYC